MDSDEKNKWDNLVGKYVWISDVRSIWLKKHLEKLGADYSDEAALVLDVLSSENKIKLRFKGKSDEYLFKTQDYKYINILNKCEILRFEVADFLAFGKSVDFHSKTIAECKYMKQCANFEMEMHNPAKSYAAFLVGLIILPNYNKITNIPSIVFLLFGIYSYLYYLKHRSRYAELILKLEARILSEVNSEQKTTKN